MVRNLLDHCRRNCVERTDAIGRATDSSASTGDRCSIYRKQATAANPCLRWPSLVVVEPAVWRAADRDSATKQTTKATACSPSRRRSSWAGRTFCFCHVSLSGDRRIQSESTCPEEAATDCWMISFCLSTCSATCESASSPLLMRWRPFGSSTGRPVQMKTLILPF